MTYFPYLCHLNIYLPGTMKSFISCLLVFLAILPANAQHMFSRKFPFFNQLSSNEIYHIHQDREGYLWMATTNGLARYDKYRLLNFRSDYKNQNLLAGNAIVKLDDSNSYVWIATNGGLSLYDKRTCRIFPFPDERLLNRSVEYVAVDKTETAWVGVDRWIYRCDSTAHIIKEYELAVDPGKAHNIISTIYVDKENTVWVMSREGIFRYDPTTDTFLHYPPFGIKKTAYLMYQDNSSNYWLGTWGEGLWQFFPDKKGEECFQPYPVRNVRNSRIEPIIFSIEQDDTFGYLWMLSYGGLHTFKYSEEGGLENVDIHGLVDTQMMYSRFCKDREGNLWLASWDMGYTIFFDDSNVDNYPLPQLKKQLGWDANILHLCQDSDSIVWFVQDRCGLFLYDSSRDVFANSYIGEVNHIQKSLRYPGVWVNSSMEPHVRRLTQKDMKVRVEEDIPIGDVTGLMEDKDGNLWISRWSDLRVKCPGSDSLLVSEKGSPLISLMTRDKHGAVWGISKGNNRLYRLDCASGKIVYELKGELSVLLEKESVNGICIDRDGCLWLTTSLNRILRSDEALHSFSQMPLGDAMDDCTVLGILSNADNVWMIANKKVLQYNLDSQTSRSYSTSDENIVVEIFRGRAISPDEQGGLYVGGHRGFLHIHPDETSVQDNLDLLHLHINDVKVEGKSIFFGDSLNVGKNTTDKIVLSPDNRNIELFFSPLLYSLNAKYRIAYRLEGLDQDWVYPDYGQSSAFYNHLPKGTYKFYTKIEYEPGKWTGSELLLTLDKEAAFYETWYAYLFYTLLVIVCFTVATLLYMRHIWRQNQIKLKEELTRTKLNYFTHISHELLTPLTVISCISDYLDKEAPLLHRQSLMLRANADKLKRLIQQVLDYRKLDLGKLKLHVTSGDIYECIRTLCRVNFLPLAEQKNITLEFLSDTESVTGYVDFDKLDKIVHNLLSNALKYTPENKRVRVKVRVADEEGCRMLVMKVQDQGIGIAGKELERIFTPFYNNDRKDPAIESNGIGLSLTRDLVMLHHGAISVKSTPGKGTCFTVQLPIDREGYVPDELMDETTVLTTLSAVPESGEDLPSADADKATLLLIDDNTELLYLMKEMFKERYHVLTATNGQQALERLSNHEVTVIVCDVMLPDVNGWKLCTRIKSDVNFSHIPVIILTAKNGIDDRVASYDAGADGYIAKPFDLKILFARVDNLIKSYRMRQAAFRKEENLDLDHLSYPLVEKEFLQSIIHSVEQHLEEPEFDLEKLSAEMGMSKSTLYRKIKTMTGMSSIDFVRNVKMKRACMMLVDGHHNISEVAYALGFSSPKYFTKCFKEEFGITPSEYIQKH